jgi:hypothetical protein
MSSHDDTQPQEETPPQEETMALFDRTSQYGPSLTEPKHFQKLREIADKAAAKAAKQAADKLSDDDDS